MRTRPAAAVRRAPSVAPVGSWEMKRSGERRWVRSPVSADVVEECPEGSMGCATDAIEQQLRGLRRRAKHLRRPVFLRRGKGRTTGYDKRTLYVDFWSIWVLNDHPRQGWGLQAGKTSVYGPNGRLQHQQDVEELSRRLLVPFIRGATPSSVTCLGTLPPRESKIAMQRPHE